MNFTTMLPFSYPIWGKDIHQSDNQSLDFIKVWDDSKNTWQIRKNTIPSTRCGLRSLTFTISLAITNFLALSERTIPSAKILKSGIVSRQFSKGYLSNTLQIKPTFFSQKLPMHGCVAPVCWSSLSFRYKVYIILSRPKNVIF